MWPEGSVTVRVVQGMGEMQRKRVKLLGERSEGKSWWMEVWYLA